MTNLIIGIIGLAVVMFAPAIEQLAKIKLARWGYVLGYFLSILNIVIGVILISINKK